MPVVKPMHAISRVIVSHDAAKTRTAARLTAWARAHQVPVTLEQPGAEDHAAPELGVGASKRSLRVVRHRGAVLKPCTGRTDSLLCCDLHVLTQTVGCPLDCSYCILQGYQNRASIVVQADPEQILDRLEQELASRPDQFHRVCTGQVADSLALEPEVGFAAEAVARFASLENAALELKTKTDRVDCLLDLPHGGRTIVSWSLAPAAVVDAEEHGCAPLSARLAAAARVAAAGYPLAFHLDPMIGGQADLARQYQQLVRQVATAVPPRSVVYVSMGSVRFMPAMRRTLLERHPGSRVTHGELLPDVDGKLRLLAPLRVELYREVAAALRSHLPRAMIYLCMEPPRIWRRALGQVYGGRAEVDQALARSLARHRE